MLPRERGPGSCKIGGCALEHDPAAVMAGARAEVDDPVGVRHDGLVVLDHDDAVAGLHEAIQHVEQIVDVREVQARRRLVEHVHRPLLRHRDGELEALSFPAGECVERLAEGDVTEADLDHSRQSRVRRPAPDELAGFSHRHGHDLVDVPAVEAVLEHLVGEPRAIAHLTHRLDCRIEAQIGQYHAESLALGACAGGVGAEQGRLDAIGLGEGGTDGVEQTRVRRRVAAARTADRRLVDHDNVVERRKVAVDQR